LIAYAAQHTLRASPPPHSARPVPHGRPVDYTCTTPWGFPCCARLPCVHAVATTPAQRLAASLAHFTKRISLPRIGGQVGLCNDLFVDEIADSGLATAIPLYVCFKARQFPIVGTTLDYFDFRRLVIAQGRPLGLLGEAVIGADVADQLGMAAGDSLLSSPETVFDLAGVYPLKMRVVGILQRSHTPDDLAVFVDVKTAWVVQGLVHGHADLSRSDDATVIIDRTDANVVASAKVVEYTEITEQNIDSFHFHGDPAQYPLSGVIVVPEDDKSGTILRGRYLAGEIPHQLVVPGTVIDGLLANIFRIKNVLDAVIFIVGIATALALTLVFALSIRLRQREISTLFRLGGSRLTIARLLVAEIAIIGAASATVCGILLLAVNHYSGDLVRTLFIR
jgi:putative ABC transport system permease protein